jgi:energy-converting hydrogenase B subunit D
MIWIALLAVIIMLAVAVAVVFLRNLMAAVAAASVVSLALSVLFIILRAPDVAMTEAVVGAGLSSLLFALTLYKLGLASEDNPGDNQVE